MEKPVSDILIPNARRRWTQQEIALIKVRLDAARTKQEWDMTIDSIALKLGRSTKSIASMVNKTIGKTPQIRKGYLIRDEKPAVNANNRIHVYPVNRGRIREALICLVIGGCIGYFLGVSSAIFYLGQHV